MITTIKRGCDRELLAAARLKCTDLEHDSEVINRALAQLAGLEDPPTAKERTEAATRKGGESTKQKYKQIREGKKGMSESVANARAQAQAGFDFRLPV